MDFSEAIKAIDVEIARLNRAKAILSDDTQPAAPMKTTAKKTAGKRTLSPEARARIAAGQKKRWAAQRKAAK